MKKTRYYTLILTLALILSSCGKKEKSIEIESETSSSTITSTSRENNQSSQKELIEISEIESSYSNNQTSNSPKKIPVLPYKVAKELPRTPEKYKIYEEKYFLYDMYFTSSDKSDIYNNHKNLSFVFNKLAPYMRENDTSFPDDVKYVEENNVRVNYFPAKLFEEIFLKYFDISKEQLRSGVSYIESVDSYKVLDKFGGGYPIAVITNVTENQNELIIYATYYNAMDQYAMQDTKLTIKLLDKDNFKYVSNEIVATYESKPPEITSTVTQEYVPDTPPNVTDHTTNAIVPDPENSMDTSEYIWGNEDVDYTGSMWDGIDLPGDPDVNTSYSTDHSDAGWA